MSRKLYLPKAHSDIYLAYQNGTLANLPYTQRLIDSVLARLTTMGVLTLARGKNAWEVITHE